VGGIWNLKSQLNAGELCIMHIFHRCEDVKRSGEEERRGERNMQEPRVGNLYHASIDVRLI
jgi:hypothetical protein